MAYTGHIFTPYRHVRVGLILFYYSSLLNLPLFIVNL